MKSTFILISFLTFNSYLILAQSGDERKIEKFEKILNEKELFKQINDNKTETEKLVVRLKEANVFDDQVIKQYRVVRQHFDIVIDTMIADIKNANTIGGLVEELITRKSKRKTYEALLNEATDKMDNFKKSAYEKLSDKKGIWKTLVDWAVSFLPGYVKKISDSSLGVVQKMITQKLESVRFSKWEEL